MKDQDEDRCYEQWKQRQIDSNRLTPRPYLIIGSALPAGERIQKSVRTDPHPEIPFNDSFRCEMTGLEKVIWTVLFAAILALTMINPWSW